MLLAGMPSRGFREELTVQTVHIKAVDEFPHGVTQSCGVSRSANPTWHFSLRRMAERETRAGIQLLLTVLNDGKQ